MNGSRRPLVPMVEVRAGWPASSVHFSALLPRLAAKEIFSPATLSPVKYANAYPFSGAGAGSAGTLAVKVFVAVAEPRVITAVNSTCLVSLPAAGRCTTPVGLIVAASALDQATVLEYSPVTGRVRLPRTSAMLVTLS